MKTRAQVLEEHADREIDRQIAARMSRTSLAAVPPVARVKVRQVLKRYAKQDKPFQACVTDNMAKYGPGRTEAVCAPLKVAIKSMKIGDATASYTSASDAVIDADVLLALDAISEIDLQKIFLEARALEEHGTAEAVALLNLDGRSELQRWGAGVEGIQLAELELATLDAKKRGQLKSEDFALPPDGYPMQDIAHARNALARAAQHATPDEQATIKKRVYARWPQLKSEGSK